MMQVIKNLAQVEINPEDLDIPKTGDVTSGNIGNVLQVVFGIGGGIALIVIIIAGIQFILSRGDPQKSAVARSAIIYALIGLAVMVSAFAIVGFVVESV